MMGSNDEVLNPRHFQWVAWLADFRAAFGLRDLAQDVLNRIEVLQQGSKTITEYCTTFFELKGRLSPMDAASDYVKDRFWKGLNVAAMEALVNSDFNMVEQARDILLHREHRLTDLAAQRKSGWQAAGANGHHTAASKPGTSAATTMVCAALPSPSADLNAMDVDQAKTALATRRCFKCKQTRHLMGACPQWVAAIKVAVRDALAVSEVKVEEPPK
ncbi:hypothetical protein C0993_011418, partial [Termitomyces sp. T159_Od127]